MILSGSGNRIVGDVLFDATKAFSAGQHQPRLRLTASGIVGFDSGRSPEAGCRHFRSRSVFGFFFFGELSEKFDQY
jgi:hypothetical protein